MAVKVQYVTSDNKVFDDEVEAKEYEKELARTEGIPKVYRVTLTLLCSSLVEAFDEDEAAEKIADDWYCDRLEDAHWCHVDTDVDEV